MRSNLNTRSTRSGDAVQAVIFDMDGVIVDSEPRHERAFLDVMEAIGLTGRHGIRFADYIGRSDRDLWKDFLKKNSTPHSFEQLLVMKRRRVVEIIQRDQPLFAGVSDLVRALAPQYRLALASGSERAIVDAVLGLDGLAGYFKATVSCTEAKKGKPDPEIFLRAAELVGAPAEQCCVIEDSKPGIAAALAAGMEVIAIANTHPAEELRHAHHVVTTYQEIRHLLLPSP